MPLCEVATMAKLLIRLQGVALREISLSDDETTIGRRSRNRVVLDTVGVSGMHAVVRHIGTDFEIEDRGSTNGTFVNGQPVTRQVLRSGDNIEVGEYRLRFIAEEDSAPLDAAQARLPSAPAVSFDRAVQAAPAVRSGISREDPAPAGARLRILFGANAGREFRLLKGFARLGRAGHETAIVARRASGYFIEHHRGEVFPSVNGVSIGSAPHRLADTDVIEVAGVVIQFLQPDHVDAPAQRPVAQRGRLSPPEVAEQPAPQAMPASAAGSTQDHALPVHGEERAELSLSRAAANRLRNLLHFRTPRAVPKRGPRPNPGARACFENLRMTVQAGMTAELWNWLQDAGWREITYRPDRRHYCEIPTERVYELIECAADERRNLLDSTIEHARAGHPPFLNARLDSGR
jgi:hypothetical protein